MEIFGKARSLPDGDSRIEKHFTLAFVIRIDSFANRIGARFNLNAVKLKIARYVYINVRIILITASPVQISYYPNIDDV